MSLRTGLSVFARGFRRCGLQVAITVLLVAAPFAVVSAAPPVSGAATIPSSQGTDFWVAFENNDAAEQFPQNIFLFISGDTATSGTVAIPGISSTQSFTVTPGVATQVSIPLNAEDDNPDGIDALGIHVTANNPVSVYGLNTKEFTTDGFLGLPTPILGTSYIIESYLNDGAGTQFAVVGVSNNTTATITPSETVGSHAAGVPYTVSLNQGDVYQLTDSTSSSGDLSGTTVTSAVPVAVFGGHACANIPDGSVSACNTLAEEMTPINTWGTDFLTEPLATRSGDTFRIMASTANTTVSLNGAVVATLDAGKFFQTPLSTASVITADKPVQVMQYSNGTSFDNVSSDPFDITIPPTEQFLNSYTVSAEPSGADPAITQNYLNVVAPTSEVAGVTLDGSLVPASSFSPIPGSTYSGAQLAVDFGSHTISAALPFGLSVYGDGNTDGYGYPGGFTLSPIATVSKVALAPATASFPINSSACENATVTDQNGNPVAGVRVDFTVTGVNPTSGFAFSDTTGVAQFCYTGAVVGSDTEGAAVGAVASNSASIMWTTTGPPPPSSTSVSTSLSGGGQSGATISVPPSTAVTDAASLAGDNAATATGSVTYNVYSDNACTMSVSAGTAKTITTAGVLPASDAVTLADPGAYYWQATYSGDANNTTSTSTCGAEVETVTPPTTGGAQSTELTTSLSAGKDGDGHHHRRHHHDGSKDGQSGASISVPVGTAVTDSANLTGANAATATGTVSYTVYSDDTCTTAVSSGPESITTPGVMPDSDAVTLPDPGTYYWQATYSGDTNNLTSTSACGSEVETVTAPSPEPTNLTTSLSGGIPSGHDWFPFHPRDVVTVFAGSGVFDSATLTGPNAASAGGTVTYTVYSDPRQQDVVATDTESVVNGAVTDSAYVTLDPGVYYWEASYSGDSLNAPSMSAFGSEIEIVIPNKLPHPPPGRCGHFRRW